MKLKPICQAPFKSLYFCANGVVSFCCYSRTYDVGHYPKQNISEIWQGERAQNMRDLVSQGQLPASCAICKHHMDSGNVQAIEARLFDWQPIHSRYPTVMEFELSNQCNLKCVMCRPGLSSRWSDTKLISPYTDKFIDELTEYIPYLSQAKFLGGEPFVIAQYLKIWKLITRLNPDCTIFVQTNGTILTSEIKKLLELGNFDISISLDTVDPEQYKRIRQGASLYKTLKHIDYYHKYAIRKGRWIGLAVCPMSSNILAVPELIEYANKKQIRIYMQTVWSPFTESLRFLSTTRLQNILTQLPKEIILEQPTGLTQHNAAEYKKCLHQIKSWLEEQTQRGSQLGKRQTTVKDIERSIVQYLQQKGRSQDIEIILKKLQSFCKIQENWVYAKMATIPIDSLIYEIETLHDSQLKQLIQAIKNGAIF